MLITVSPANLFHSPTQEDRKITPEAVNTEAHRQLALEAARQGLVLLKNAGPEAGGLPLTKCAASFIHKRSVRKRIEHPCPSPAAYLQSVMFAAPPAPSREERSRLYQGYKVVRGVMVSHGAGERPETSQ